MSKPFPNTNTQFQAGQSGNPSGRPKGSLNLKTRIRRLLELNAMPITDPVTNEPIPQPTQLDEMIQGLIDKAKAGDSTAFNTLTERLVGKVPNKNENKDTTKRSPEERRARLAQLRETPEVKQALSELTVMNEGIENKSDVTI